MAKDAVATMGAVLPDDAGGRDAVHVAVISAVAALQLTPGMDVGFTADAPNERGERKAMPGAELLLGIVDPYIKGKVKPGQRFWLYIYPRKITGLNHQWSHPEIPDPTVFPLTAPAGRYDTPSQRLQSEQWLRDFVARSDCPSYEVTIGAAIQAIERGEEYVHFNGSDAHGDIPPEFWTHLSIVSGQNFDGTNRPQYFSCAC